MYRAHVYVDLDSLQSTYTEDVGIWQGDLSGLRPWSWLVSEVSSSPSCLHVCPALWTPRASRCSPWVSSTLQDRFWKSSAKLSLYNCPGIVHALLLPFLCQSECRNIASTRSPPQGTFVGWLGWKCYWEGRQAEEVMGQSYSQFFLVCVFFGGAWIPAASICQLNLKELKWYEYHCVSFCSS